MNMRTNNSLRSLRNSAPLRETKMVMVSRRGAEKSRDRREDFSRARRESMSEARQDVRFMASVNRIFTGDKLLTAANAGYDKDAALMTKLGLVPMEAEAEESLRACKALEAAE